jgi:hypothetical protein
MPSYGFAAWVENHAVELLLGGILIGGGVAAWVLNGQSKAARGRQGFADRARKGCTGCPDTTRLALPPRVRTNARAFVNDAAYQNMRNQGYVGSSIGPLGRYPGARGPQGPTPVWGSYRGQSRYALDAENGPAYGPPETIMSVATRVPPPDPNPPLTGAEDVFFHRLRDGANAMRARNAVAATPTGTYPSSFFRFREVAANQRIQDLQNQSEIRSPGNLSVSNLPPGADGNLSAPVTYQEVIPPGGTVPPTPVDQPAPWLGEGGRGYLGQSARMGAGRARYVMGSPGGIPIGPVEPVQSVATAFAASSPAQGEIRSFPWWHPHAEVGPLGSSYEARGDFALDAAGGGYVNPTAYDASAEYASGDNRFRHFVYGEAKAAQQSPIPGRGDGSFPAGTLDFTVPASARHVGAYAPRRPTDVAGPYEPVYETLMLQNTVDIQTQDFPGGEVGYNLSVGNLPDGANGNLSAPVTFQQLAPAGGIAAPDESRQRDLAPYLDWGGET